MLGHLSEIHCLSETYQNPDAAMIVLEFTPYDEGEHVI